MEPKGKEYINKHTGTVKKALTLVMAWKNISDHEFDAFFQKIDARSFYEKADYDWIKTQLDIENYMAFVLAVTYFGNTDALGMGDHNLHIVKEDGGLWQWKIFDFDCTMVDNDNYLEGILKLTFGDSVEEEKKNFSAWLFQRLWRCEDFRNDFIVYSREKLDTHYTKENLTSAFEAHLQMFEDEMPENLRRCEKGYTKLKQLSFAVRGIKAEYENYTMDDWKIVVNDMRRFLANRTERVREFLDELETEESNLNAD